MSALSVLTGPLRRFANWVLATRIDPHITDFANRTHGDD